MRIAALAGLAVLAGACVNSQNAHNGAIRIVNAGPDVLPIRLLLDDEIRASSYAFGNGSGFVATHADTYQVKVQELLPAAADPNTEDLVDESVELQINQEVTYVVVGEEGAGSLQVLQILDTTTGVPLGKTRLQFLHAAVGGPDFDVYVTAPDAVLTASAPFASGKSYTTWTDQQEVTPGNSQIVLTAPGDPTTILFQSSTLYLPPQADLLIVVIPNPSFAAHPGRPFALTLLSGTGSTLVQDKDAQSELRVVNASPGSYSLDVFLDSTNVDGTARQTCDPLTTEEGTYLELCALPFESIGPYNTVDPSGSYQLKFQKTGDDAVAAQNVVYSFVAGGGSTAVLTGLIDDSATTTTIGVHSVSNARPAAEAAQLRIVDASLAADQAVAGDPSTDRLDLYITAPDASLADEAPDFVGFTLGSDTGYLYEVAGNYKVTLVKVDSATPEVAPVELASLQVAIANDGIYTLLIVDSTGGVEPLQFLSIDDDPTPP